MTIDEFAELTKGKPMLTPADVQKVTRVHPSNTLEYARNGQLPYHCMWSGDHLKIPREGFLRWWAGEKQEKEPPRQDGFGRFRLEFVGNTPQELFDQMIGYLTACNIFPQKKMADDGGTSAALKGETK